MAVDPVEKPKKSPLVLHIVSLVAVLSLILLLLPQLISRFNYQQGVNSLRKGNITEAELLIEKAAGWLPRVCFSNDRKRIKIIEGDIHFQKAESSEQIAIFLAEMEAAEKSYREAALLQPLDVDAYTGLGRAAEILERLYPFVNNQPYPTKALPTYQHLLDLMPTNLYSLSLLTKYYYSRGMVEDLSSIISKSISMYPALYFQLKQQPFYNDTMNQMIHSSLFTAVENELYEEAAYRALADLALRTDNYKDAIEYYNRSMAGSPYKDTSGGYLHLGRLYLKASQWENGEQAFIKALKTGDRIKLLERIRHSYKNEKHPDKFLPFVNRIEKMYSLPESVEILKAGCLIDVGRFELAEVYLQRISAAKYKPESLYQQARIAEKQQDWDTMELKSQRATVLDPEKSHYHLLFSRALQKQKKWPQAEQAAGNAIAHSSKSNPWLYNHRAWIRWNRKDMEGALSDWERAVSISPQTAAFYHHMALVFERGGNTPEALKQINKALTIKPDQEKYLRFKEKIENRK
ncbi:MAG: tetratricopeptide repeat protein [Desulfocapsa sp.]|nr:tetratricopeptide repeat protein [Desulfocapsa sp.]MBN4064044.1 tetratricopeptide repeat protein [bacterium AH-315-I07]